MTARELAARLGLHRSRRDWRGPCPACGYADAFLLTDGKAGPIGWCACCHNEDAIAQALGSQGADPGLGAATPRSQENDVRDAQARLERAEKVWRGSGPVLGTAAAVYLDVRGVAHLATCRELRFRLDCPHPTGTIERRVRLPALVAAVRDVDGKFLGVHRTFLRRDGTGKADIEPQKASLGPVCGGAVRLAPIEEVLAAGELVLGEGIETSASAGLLMRLPAWAAISAGNLAKGVVLPSTIRKVIIAADRDPPDEKGRRPGQDAARAAWLRFRRQGRAVRIATPNEGEGDFNDLLLRRGARI
jgi:phage/plasmid primase-like uncharacterized protein